MSTVVTEFQRSLDDIRQEGREEGIKQGRSPDRSESPGWPPRFSTVLRRRSFWRACEAEGRLRTVVPVELLPRCETRGPIAFVLLSFAGLSFAGACVEDSTPGEAVLTPEVIGSASVPLSENNNVAVLADGHVACVIESYEDRVHCVDREGGVVGSFGREGEGPGEFGSPAALVRGDRGTIGVMDFELSRFSVFEPSGAFVSSVTVPGVTFSPVGSFDTVVTGVSRRFVMPGEDDDGPLMTLYEVDIASGGTVREEGSGGGPWDVECGRVISGIPDPRGGWVFLACGGHLVFDRGAGAEATVVRAPTYTEEFPDEQEVVRRREEIETLNRSFAELGLEPSQSVEEQLEEYRATPKRYYLSTSQHLFGAGGRYWVATHRDLQEWSYLDVYEDTEYVATVKVRDRMLAFDAVGSTLVVLVERQLGAEDEDGVPDRAVDWYEVGGVG